MFKNKTEVLDVLARSGGLDDVIKTYSVGTEQQSSVLPQAIVVDAEVLNALKWLRDYAGIQYSYAALSQYGWGRDVNPLEAFKKCKQQFPLGARAVGKIRLYRIHPATTIRGDGGWEYPQGFPPEYIQE